MAEQVIEETLLDKVVEVDPADFGGSGNFKMPSLEDVMKMIDSMQDITDEERENLKSSIMFPDEKAAEKLRQLGGAPQAGPSSRDYVLFLAMLALIALVFALFGYKLYKSLKEKELKKQEKQKLNKKSKKIKQK